jgi:hypothetical protein
MTAFSNFITYQCTPTIRTWPGQRCVPCEVSDLPCGPNVHSRQSTATKLGNTSSPARNIVTSGAEFHAENTTNDSILQGIIDLDCPLSLPGSGADWDYSMESFDMFSLDCLSSMPFEEPQLQKETWPGTMVGHSDESSRESLSALGNLAPSDNFLEIDQRFVISNLRSDSLTNQKRQFCPPWRAPYTF